MSGREGAPRREAGPAAALGRPHLHLREVDSTNERARALAAAGAPHGTLVTADHQTAGRGRQGRAWSAPPGRALLMSLVLRDLDELQPLLPLAAAVAVCEAAERSAEVACEIKWPNDVWIGGRKLAGILIEGRPQAGWLVLGLGINVGTRSEEFPPELHDAATSLAIEGHGEPPAVGDLLAAVLEALSERLADPPDALLEAWRARDALRGRPIEWEGGKGIATGIDERGALLVDTDAGTRTLEAGEVHLGRPALEEGA